METRSLITLALALFLLIWNIRTDPGVFRAQKLAHGALLLTLVWLFSYNLSYLLVIVGFFRGTDWINYFTVTDFERSMKALWALFNALLSLSFAVILVFLLNRNNTARKIFLFLAPAFFVISLTGSLLGYTSLRIWEWILYPLLAIGLPLFYSHPFILRFFGETTDQEQKPLDMG